MSNNNQSTHITLANAAGLSIHDSSSIFKRGIDALSILCNDTYSATSPDLTVLEMFNKGWEAYAIGSFAEAENWYRLAAEQGDVDAQINLINIYIYKLHKLDQADYWITRATECCGNNNPSLLSKVNQERVKLEIKRFALSKPANVFECVRNSMADAIDADAKLGIDLSLEDAYIRAVGVNYIVTLDNYETLGLSDADPVSVASIICHGTTIS